MRFADLAAGVPIAAMTRPTVCTADTSAAYVVDAWLGPYPGDDAVGRAWVSDIASLLRIAQRIAPQARELRLRLDWLVGDGCSLFHVDRTPLRLVCTYLGPGTQWLPDGAFARAGLGCGCNDHVRDWGAVEHIATGHVALMKGEAYPGNAGCGLVHRSPPASPDAPRLLLAIDFD